MKFKILTTAALFSSATFVTAEKPIPKMLRRIIPDHLSDNERNTFIQKVESISKRFEVKEKRHHPHIMVQADDEDPDAPPGGWPTIHDPKVTDPELRRQEEERLRKEKEEFEKQRKENEDKNTEGNMETVDPFGETIDGARRIKVKS